MLGTRADVWKMVACLCEKMASCIGSHLLVDRLSFWSRVSPTSNKACSVQW